MRKHYTIIILILAVSLHINACHSTREINSISTVSKAQTESFSPKPTLTKTITPVIKVNEDPTEAPTISPTSEITLTPGPDSILISYAYNSDGGDDLELCLMGHGRLSIVLYGDGSFIRLRERQYWQSHVTDEEIAALFDELAMTGLFLHTEEEYREGGNVLEVKGKRYIALSDLSDDDPLSRAMKILFQYKPVDEVKYMPDELLLGISRVIDLEAIERYYTQEEPIVNDWESDPLSAYGEVWKVIRGEELLNVMAQFESFPDYKLLRDGDTYYIAMICGISP